MTVTMSIPAYIPILAATTAAQSLVSLAMLSPAAVAPAIARDLQVSGAMIGWWISMAYGGAMITSLLGGNAVRRFGATRSTQIGLLLVCLGGGAMMAGTLPLALLAALLTGLGYGMTNPAASHLLARSTSPERRNLVFSIKQTGVPLGGTLAGLIAPRLTQAWGWPAAMASVALTCLGLALLLALARHSWDSDRDPKSRMTGNPFSGLVSIWRSPRLKALSLTGFAYAAVQLSVSTFAVTMLVTDLSWSLVDAGLLLSAVQVAGVVGRISIGSLADRFFRRYRYLDRAGTGHRHPGPADRVAGAGLAGNHGLRHPGAVRRRRLGLERRLSGRIGPIQRTGQHPPGHRCLAVLHLWRRAGGTAGLCRTAHPGGVLYRHLRPDRPARLGRRPHPDGGTAAQQLIRRGWCAESHPPLSSDWLPDRPDRRRPTSPVRRHRNNAPPIG